MEILPKSLVIANVIIGFNKLDMHRTDARQIVITNVPQVSLDKFQYQTSSKDSDGVSTTIYTPRTTSLVVPVNDYGVQAGICPSR
jgi:lactate dehydrogenase-like 2-hydroxyacid dehydrogenase